jgi:16S rRNA (guanine527-N7)-methyltransferase
MTVSPGDLAARHQLASGAADRLGILADLLIEPDAPTAIRSREQVLRDHLADSLVALAVPQVLAARAVADVGSGAGLPGLPLAIGLPRANITLVESNARKCEFIEAAIAACGLDNARVVCTRAEEWTDGIGRCDLVTARALAPLPVVAEYAAPLLSVGGTLVAWRGRRDRVVEDDADRVAPLLGLQGGAVLRVSPYTEAEHRHLHLMLKVTDTPSRFPRRAGMARKRPLGSPSDRQRR